MDHRTLLTAGLVAVVLVTGCIGAPGASSPDGSPANTPGSDTPTTPDGTETPAEPRTDDSSDDLENESEDTPSDAPGDPGTTPEPQKENATESLETFDVKAAIVDEYDPGTCFGMPTVVTEEQANATVADREALVDAICNEYDVDRNETFELYSTIQQFEQVQVTERTDGTYAFELRDGNCCTITTITGIYDPETGEISESARSSETVPC